MDNKTFPAGMVFIKDVLQMSLPRNGATICTDILISEPLTSDIKDNITATTMTIPWVGFHAFARNSQ